MNDKLKNYANFEKSISEARTAKQAYERFFEKELLAQISKIIDSLPYGELVKLNGKPIKITHQNQIKVTIISIGYVNLYVHDFTSFITDYRQLRLRQSDIYTGFCTAYSNLFKRLLDGATIPGIIFKVSLFRKGQLVLDI